MDRKKDGVVKRGNRLGFWAFRTAARTFGLRGAYGLLSIVCLYYLVFDRSAVETTMAYVRRRFRGHGGLRRRWDVYRIFIEQGKSLIDRYAVLSGSAPFEIGNKGLDDLKKTLQTSGKGVILLTAHVGNWQVAMTALQRLGRTVHLLMRPEDNAAVRAALNIDQDHGSVRILSSDGPLGGVVEAVSAVNEGEVVSIMGDRPYGYRSLEAEFLGERVHFPIGAFSIAAAARCPVVVLLSAKVSANRYMVDLTHVIEPPVGAGRAKQEAVARCIREFSRILEGYVAEHPYQWFVFRDIWKSNE